MNFTKAIVSTTNEGVEKYSDFTLTFESDNKELLNDLCQLKNLYLVATSSAKCDLVNLIKNYVDSAITSTNCEIKNIKHKHPLYMFCGNIRQKINHLKLSRLEYEADRMKLDNLDDYGINMDWEREMGEQLINDLNFTELEKTKKGYRTRTTYTTLQSVDELKMKIDQLKKESFDNYQADFNGFIERNAVVKKYLTVPPIAHHIEKHNATFLARKAVYGVYDKNIK